MNSDHTQDGIGAFLEGFFAPDNPNIPLLVLQNPPDKSFLRTLVDRASARGFQTKVFSDETRVRLPYGPLLSWAARELSLLPNETREAILRKARVYSAHLPLLMDWIEGKPVERHEELLPQELDFERQSLLNALTRVFRSLVRSEPTIFIIDQAQFLRHSAYAFLKRLWKKTARKRRHRFRVVLIVYEGYPGDTSQIDSKYQEFLHLAESHGHLIRLDGRAVPESPPPAPEGLREATDAYELLALKDAADDFLSILNRHTTGEAPLDSRSHVQVLERLGSIHFLNKEFDLAISFWQSGLSLAQQIQDKSATANLLIRIGHVFFEKCDLDHAQSLQQQARKIAQEIGNERTYFDSLFLMFLIQDKIRTQSLDEFRAFYQEILVLAKKLGYSNRLSFLSCNPFGLFSDFSDEYESYHTMGLAIAGTNGNLYRLAYAYQTAGLVESVRGNYRKTIEYYRKSLELKKKLNNPLELAYINNGIGFYHYMTGDYGNAHQHYLQATHYLRRAKNFEEIGMTLFNLAVNALLAFEFEDAVFFTRTCLELLRTLRMRNLSYHSQLGIQVVLGTAYALSQQFSKAWQVVLYIDHMQLKPFPRKNEEFFLLHFLKALLDGVKEDWERAEFYLFEANDNIQYFAPFYYTHRGDHLQHFVSGEAAATAWRKGLEMAQKQGNSFYRDLLLHRLQTQKPKITRYGLTRSRAGWSWILAAARLQKQLVTIHEQFEEIQFLNTFQTLIMQSSGFGDLTQKAGELLYQKSQVKAVYIGQIIKRRTGILFQRGFLEFNHPYMSALMDLVFQTGRRSSPRLPPLGGELPTGWTRYGFWSHLFRVDQDQAVFLLCILELENESSQIACFQSLNGLASSFEAAWMRLVQSQTIEDQLEDLKRKNLLLEKTSTTDHLTGVGNRHALHQTLKKEMARVNRCRSDPPETLSVLFLDLDNFKFFNDNFGHAVGDRILELTARLLESVVRSTDLVFRYGGDEFVIVLPDTGPEGARDVAQRILRTLTEARSFQTALESKTGYGLFIPEDRHLGCSIGIASYNGQPTKHTDYVLLLNQADNCLYQAKIQGKGQAV